MSRKLTVIKQNKKRRRKMFYRRVMTMTLVVVFFVISVAFMYSDRVQRLREVEIELAQLQQEHEEIMAQQEFYLSEINKLSNDEYIAMLARQKFFKSLPNEILFNFGEIGELEDVEDLDEN